MKGVFIILDGAADEPSAALGYKTPLEAAKTPHLDSIAARSNLDYCYTVKEGVVPESSNAIVSLLGYDSVSVSRGELEARGAGVRVARGDLVLRTNFATIDDLKTMNLLDRRAGRTLSTKDARVLAKAINEGVKLPFKFTFYPTIGHRGVVVFRGGFSDNISNVDPHYGVDRVSSRVSFSAPLDDEEDSRLSAEILNSFVRQSHEILDKHPLNKQRVRKGLFSANFILCRDAGTTIPQFRKLKGSWKAMTYFPLEIGIVGAAKMDLYSFSYPSLKGIDVYANLYSGLKKALKRSVKMLRKYREDYDYFFIHIKETDIPGHDNKPLDKVKMFELIDQRLFVFLNGFLRKYPARLVITADHTTSCRMKEHTEAPVPVLFYDPKSLHKRQHRFIEKDALKGKKILGRKLLEKTIFS